MESGTWHTKDKNWSENKKYSVPQCALFYVVHDRIVQYHVALRHSPSQPRTLAITRFVPISLFRRGWQQSDRSRSRTRQEGGGSPLFALFYLPRPTLFSMSTIRALLPRPAVSYALHVVAVVIRRLLCTSRPCHCTEISTTRIVDGIERGESRRRKRRRRRTTCGHIGVAPASLRWATMVAYIWIISKQPKVSSRTKWYTRILWLVHRLRHVSERYVCLFFSRGRYAIEIFLSRTFSRSFGWFSSHLFCSHSIKCLLDIPCPFISLFFYRSVQVFLFYLILQTL